MNAMELTVKVFDTDEEVTVTPMAVFGYGDFSTVYITDVDGHGLWLDGDFGWRVDLEEGDVCDAEAVKGVFGVDVGEWEACANVRLADYGFCLGDFDGEHNDRYFLIAL